MPPLVRPQWAQTEWKAQQKGHLYSGRSDKDDKVCNLKNRRKAHATFVQGRHPLISRRVAAYLPSLDYKAIS